MFQAIQKRLTWMNAISYFLFLVLFLSVFYISFAQMLERVQENMVESYAANNMPKFFNVFNGPPMPPNRFELEVDKVSFFYVISNELTILYGEELHDGFHEVLEKNLQPVQSKQFERFKYDSETLLVMTQAVRSNGQTLGYIAVGQNVTQYEQLLKNVVMLLLILLVVSSIGIALLSYYLARKSMAPIQRSYEQQREFVANASHELRTPLAIFYSSLELLEQQLHESGRTYAEVNDMKQEATYMKNMLASLLTLTRSDQQQLQLNLSDVDLSSVALQCVRRLAKTAPHVSFQLDVAEQCIVQADAIFIEELLYILLKNAVTYTPSGTITVRVEATDKLAKLSVSDTGIGIANEHLPRIFERFYRGDQTRHTAGTGLGLAIAQVIAELHDGRIDVTSEVGKGSTFTVELPMN